MSVRVSIYYLSILNDFGSLSWLTITSFSFSPSWANLNAFKVHCLTIVSLIVRTFCWMEWSSLAELSNPIVPVVYENFIDMRIGIGIPTYMLLGNADKCKDIELMLMSKRTKKPPSSSFWLNCVKVWWVIKHTVNNMLVLQLQYDDEWWWRRENIHWWVYVLLRYMFMYYVY